MVAKMVESVANTAIIKGEIAGVARLDVVKSSISSNADTLQQEGDGNGAAVTKMMGGEML